MPAASLPEPEIEYARLHCQVHGAYDGYRKGAMTQACPRCTDAPMAAELRAKRARADEQLRRAKVRALESTAGIPKKFERLRLEDYRATLPGQQLALAICKAYADTWSEQCSKGATLLFIGLTGTGKTHLACAIANAVMADHLSTVAFGTASDFGREIRSTYGRQRGDRSELQVMQALRAVDLLIFDDVGAQLGSDHEMQMLFDIVDGRWRDERATIVTSNLNRDDLRKYLGTRAMDRLLDRGTVVAFDWPSYRGQQQENLL